MAGVLSPRMVSITWRVVSITRWVVLVRWLASLRRREELRVMPRFSWCFLLRDETLVSSRCQAVKSKNRLGTIWLNTARPWGTAPTGGEERCEQSYAVASACIALLDRRREHDHAHDTDGSRHPERHGGAHVPQQAPDERRRRDRHAADEIVEPDRAGAQ